MTARALATLYAIIEAALAAQVEKRKTPPVEAPAGQSLGVAKPASGRHGSRFG